MICTETHLGKIVITQSYFSKLIGHAVTSCFGVAGMANSNARQGLRSAIFKKDTYINKGVSVRKDNDGISIDLHIIVTYGLNISAIVKSIINKVRYTVEQATGLKVQNVNVYVDSMITE